MADRPELPPVVTGVATRQYLEEYDWSRFDPSAGSSKPYTSFMMDAANVSDRSFVKLDTPIPYHGYRWGPLIFAWSTVPPAIGGSLMLTVMADLPDTAVGGMALMESVERAQGDQAHVWRLHVERHGDAR